MMKKLIVFCCILLLYSVCFAQTVYFPIEFEPFGNIYILNDSTLIGLYSNYSGFNISVTFSGNIKIYVMGFASYKIAEVEIISPDSQCSIIHLNVGDVDNKTLASTEFNNVDSGGWTFQFINDDWIPDEHDLNAYISSVQFVIKTPEIVKPAKPTGVKVKGT